MKNTPSGGAFFVPSVRECDEEAAEHQKHTHVGVFSRFGMRGVVGEPPDTKNTSRGVFFVSSMSAMVRDPPDTRNTSRGRVFHVQHEGRG